MPRRAGNRTTITVLTFGLMANLAPMANFAAVMPEITEDWGLSASQAGWIGGIYFGGYAACVPILAGATDKIDARWVFVGCSLLGLWRASPLPGSHTVSGWRSCCAS